MQKIRIICFSSNDGGQESVMFTEDFETPADDFAPFDQSVDSDTITDIMNFPIAFPLDRILHRD